VPGLSTARASHGGPRPANNAGPGPCGSALRFVAYGRLGRKSRLSRPLLDPALRACQQRTRSGPGKGRASRRRRFGTNPVAADPVIWKGEVGHKTTQKTSLSLVVFAISCKFGGGSTMDTDDVLSALMDAITGSTDALGFVVDRIGESDSGEPVFLIRTLARDLREYVELLRAELEVRNCFSTQPHNVGIHYPGHN
jgi:hypothetical protein